MTTIYRLHVNELSVEVINSIKAAFKDKTVEIIVTDSVDETEYLLATGANRKHLFDSMKELEEGKGVTFTVEELQEKYGKK
jgi:hypothetical protein